MKQLGFFLSIPLVVIAWNVTDKMDQRNIDHLIDGIVWAITILAIIIPVGLYVLAYVRRREELNMSFKRHQHSAGQRRPMQLQIQHQGQPMGRQAQGWSDAGSWAAQPPMLDARADEYGSFQVDMSHGNFAQMEDWQ